MLMPYGVLFLPLILHLFAFKGKSCKNYSIPCLQRKKGRDVRSQPFVRPWLPGLDGKRTSKARTGCHSERSEESRLPVAMYKYRGRPVRATGDAAGGTGRQTQIGLGGR